MAPQMKTSSQQLSQLPILKSLPSHPPFSDSESDETSLQPGNPDSVIFSALCMFDFTTSEAGILSFKQNEILDIIKCNNGGWWAAMRKGGNTLGWIPKTFVNPLSQEMTERLRDIRQELRGAEFKRVEELYRSGQGTASLSAFGKGSAPTPRPEESKDLSNSSPSKWSAKLYHDHSGELLSIRKGQNLSRFPSRPRLLPTIPTHHRPLARSTSAQIHSPFPSVQQQGTDDTRIRSGSLSAQNPRWQPVTVDDNVTLTGISALIESTNSTQIDSLATSSHEASSRAMSKVISKQAQEGKLPKKFTEAGGTSFVALSSSVHRRLELDKAKKKENEPGGPIIDIGHLPAEGTPWYLRSQYANQLEVDSKGNVRTGTLLSLFEMLTTDPGTYDATKLAQFRTFTNVFLMTFRSFTTVDNLFDMLVKRFHIKPEKSLTEHEYMDWKANLRNPVQRLVLEVFSIWLMNYWLLEEEPHIAQRLKDFLAPIVSPPCNTTAIMIIHTIDRLTSTNPIRVAIGSKKARKFKLDLFKLDPKEIAEQLAVYEFGLYVKITPHQCLTYIKTRTGNDVAKLRDFCSTHDKLDAWVKMSILDSDGIGKRAHTIDFWIKVAERCRALNNISSMSAIITALSSTAITDLHLTWAHTSRKSALVGLLRYSQPTGGFAGYRSLLRQAEGPCVPFITMFLTEMNHVQDQFSDTEGRIYFHQRTRWYDIITAMLRFQSRPYEIPAEEPTINFIEGHLREGSCCDPGWFWKRSQEIQKAEVTHADIRKGLEAAGF